MRGIFLMDKGDGKSMAVTLSLEVDHKHYFERNRLFTLIFRLGYVMER